MGTRLKNRLLHLPKRLIHGHSSRKYFRSFRWSGSEHFEDPKPVATPTKKVSTSEVPSRSKSPDTVIVPAQNDGFRDVFLRENCWHAIRISGGMLDKIKYIAAYQTSPTTAITHFAPVDRIEPYGESGKYRLVFAKPATEIGPIPYADAPSGAMQGPRYTTSKN